MIDNDEEPLAFGPTYLLDNSPAFNTLIKQNPTLFAIFLHQMRNATKTCHWFMEIS
jgi:hypothetical protein